jgi:hypothetical protein
LRKKLKRYIIRIEGGGVQLSLATLTSLGRRGRWKNSWRWCGNSTLRRRPARDSLRSSRGLCNHCQILSLQHRMTVQLFPSSECPICVAKASPRQTCCFQSRALARFGAKWIPLFGFPAFTDRPTPSGNLNIEKDYCTSSTIPKCILTSSCYSNDSPRACRLICTILLELPLLTMPIFKSFNPPIHGWCFSAPQYGVD